jgi:hypothetical protein
LDGGETKDCAERLVQPALAADAVPRAADAGAVRQHSLKSVGGFGFERCDALVKSKAITYTSSTARRELPLLNNGGSFVRVQKMTGRKSPKPPQLETRAPDTVPLEKTGRITL